MLGSLPTRLHPTALSPPDKEKVIFSRSQRKKLREFSGGWECGRVLAAPHPPASLKTPPTLPYLPPAPTARPPPCSFCKHRPGPCRAGARGPQRPLLRDSFCSCRCRTRAGARVAGCPHLAGVWSLERAEVAGGGVRAPGSAAQDSGGPSREAGLALLQEPQPGASVRQSLGGRRALDAVTRAGHISLFLEHPPRGGSGD